MNKCGCCQAPVSPTPKTIENRPGLSAIAYRVGDYASFRQAMLSAIAGQTELTDWTTRDSDDYGIALLEMWAYLGDILTFYQERIANEAFLRTAIFRESVMRLAALLDYEPAPGVAASAYIAFTVEDEATVEITPGMRVQSVPGQNETAQKFETMEDLTAVSGLNEFRVFPRPQDDNPLAANSADATALGDISHLSPGDTIVIFEQLEVAGSKAKKVSGTAVEKTIEVHYVNVAGETHQMDYGEAKEMLAFDAGGSGAHGYAYERPDGEYIQRVEKTLAERGQQVIVEKVVKEAVMYVSDCGSRLFNVEDKEIEDIQTVDWRQEVSWTPEVRCSFGSEAYVYKWLRKFRLFGHNAPATSFSVSADAKGNVTWQQGVTDYYLAGGNTLALDAVYDDLKENARLLVVARREGDGAVVKLVTVDAVEQGVAQLTSDKSAVTVEGTVTKLALSDALPDGIDVRTAQVYELEEPEIELWPKQYPTTFDGNAIYVPLVEWNLDPGNADDVQEAEGLLELGRRIILRDSDSTVQATAVTESEVDGDHLKITLDDALDKSLDTATATAQANVVLGTHGETVADEVLGNGDAASAYQSFALKKSPVTFVPEAGAKNGAANTLEVRVDGVLWHEEDTLYGQNGDERVYTTAVDNDGVMTVQFGDGQTGARLSTGSNNVVATYRQGIGQDGNVSAGSLTTLLDKPVGLKKAVNPMAAEGGSDAESLEYARTNAPNTVRTFDRIVSLRDFEDAARSFAGVAKARAAWEWDGLEQVVQLTVAGDDGATIEPGSQTHSNLVADLDSRRDPNRKMTVDSYDPVPVRVEAAIQVDADYVSEDVQAEALAALSDHFDFDNLDLGQAIHLSNIYRVLQDVEGVIAADVNRLQFKKSTDRDSHGASTDPVQAHLAILPAELATIEDETNDLIVNVGLG